MVGPAPLRDGPHQRAVLAARILRAQLMLVNESALPGVAVDPAVEAVTGWFTLINGPPLELLLPRAVVPWPRVIGDPDVTSALDP